LAQSIFQILSYLFSLKTNSKQQSAMRAATLFGYSVAQYMMFIFYTVPCYIPQFQ